MVHVTVVIVPAISGSEEDVDERGAQFANGDMCLAAKVHGLERVDRRRRALARTSAGARFRTPSGPNTRVASKTRHRSWA